jgi:hypothetical protein
MRFGLGTRSNDTAGDLDALLAHAPVAAVVPAATLERLRLMLAAARHHAGRRVDRSLRPVVAIVGGTGTGKSTLLNRLLDGRNVSATSFRRTYTAGLLAAASDLSALANDWASLPRRDLSADQLPAKGEPGTLSVAVVDAPLTARVVLIDSPDLDGDTPGHHALADRAFRFADAVVFVVTPEKYQMTELPPYYRLAARYAVPTLFAMNKLDDEAALADYERQLSEVFAPPSGGVPLYAIPRDDAGLAVAPGRGLAGLRDAVTTISLPEPDTRKAGVRARVQDLQQRLADQVIEPLTQRRRAIDDASGALRALVIPEAGVDVDPLTRQLQRRLQQRSVLYLIGPGRVLDRVRQVPGMMARLPRTALDFLRGTKKQHVNGDAPPSSADAPDFPAILADQFRLLHSRIEDAIAPVQGLPKSDDWKLPVTDASAVADRAMNELRAWLEQRWNATPRDTAALQKVLKLIPGGQKLTQASEVTPYLVAIACAAHHAFFGPIDLAVLAGYGLATYLVERMSNEVAGRTRDANKQIARDFADLADRQVKQAVAWLNAQAPDRAAIDAIAKATDALEGMADDVR